MILNQFNYPLKPEQPQQKYQQLESQQKIHKISDLLALRILLNTKQKEIESLSQIFRLTYYINEVQGYIETFEQVENNKPGMMMEKFDYSESPSNCFMEQVNILIEDIKKSIRNKDFDCNADEYAKIQKVIKTNHYYSKVFKQNAQLKFTNFDQSTFNNLKNSYLPEVLKKYVIDNSISIKVCKIEKPEQFNLNYFDYFLINMSMNGLLTDSFGQELYETNKIFKEKIKSIKKTLHQHNSLLIDQIQLNKKEEQDKNQQNDMDIVFNSSDNKMIKSTPLTLCIQTATEEKSCLANLKLILERIENNCKNNRYGYFQFGLTLNNNCSEIYLKSIVEFLRELNILQKDNFFKLPSEFWLIVSDGNENRTLNIMNSLFEQKNKPKPKKVSYLTFYQPQNFSNKMYFPNEVKDIIKKAYEKGLQTVPFALNNENLKFLKQNKFLINFKKISIKPQILKQKKEEDEFLDTFTINLQSMQMQGQMQNSISPIFEDQGHYFFINQRTMKQSKLHDSLEKMVKAYLQLGIKSFSYKMNLVNQKIASTFLELNFQDDQMSFIGGKKCDEYKRNIGQLQAECLNEEENRMELEDPLDDNKNNEEIHKFKKPLVNIRGSQECIDLIQDILLNIEQKKYILHEIKIHDNIPNDVCKFFNELEIFYKVWIHVAQKSLTIQGYRKTVSHLLPIIQKAILTIPKEENHMSLFTDLKMPTHWEKQDNNLKLVTINLNSEEAKKCIDQFSKTMAGQRITQIERIQNISLMKNYLFEKQKLIEKGNATERNLFHGTRACQPQMIYSSTEQGFDFRLGNEGGSFGKGTYFHDNASYSHSFKFTCPNGRSQMFLATVLIGQCIASNPQSYTAPPFINQQKGIRYDSVRDTCAIGSNQYVVYHNSKSYPLYLITY